MALTNKHSPTKEVAPTLESRKVWAGAKGQI